MVAMTKTSVICPKTYHRDLYVCCSWLPLAEVVESCSKTCHSLIKAILYFATYHHLHHHI